jgi:ADP-heptose:LPS heptosyltransferase
VKRKLILRNSLSPGDIVMLTAAVRDLHLSFPGRFATDVRTSCPELWEYNPYLTSLAEKDPEAEVIECEYPLINQCNRAPYHVIHGFADFLSDHLRIPIKPTSFRGDIHLSKPEKSWHSQIWESTGQELPFWIICAGGKHDCTIKWWDVRRYQEVVDHFRGKILFVQVGAAGHYHPPLEGVLDLRGQTTLRQLVRLVYHSQGVLCGVTCLMHLAAAVETKPSAPPNRPCVVVAGGREPPHWQAYPHHQFIHTVGALACCRNGGCWKSRTYRLGDGTEFDQQQNLCTDPVAGLPHCMHLITSDEVIRRIELYFKGGALEFLSAHQLPRTRSIMPRQAPSSYDQILTPDKVHHRMEQVTTRIPPCPTSMAGRGILICAGGPKYFPPAWVCIRMLRKLGCSLPIQLWHLGDRELDDAMKRLVAPYDVECVNAEVVRQKHPIRILRGWELKAFALLHCRFQEVLLLDSDNVPVTNPEPLFETRQFKRTGAVFWPDVRRYNPRHDIWRITGVPYRAGREFESGQILVDKTKCWRALWLARWFNEHSDFFYNYILGDKETFYFAFRKLKAPYAMPRRQPYRLPGTLCQHDFKGARVFQHRNTEEWNIWLQNRRVREFRYDRECRLFLQELRNH